MYPPGQSKAAGKHIGSAPDATMPAPGSQVPVYPQGEGKAAGKRIGPAPDATMPAGGDAGGPAGRAEFLAQHRDALIKDLQSDPDKMDRFNRLVQAEVGNQGPLAQRAFIQSTLDRWGARGQTADQGMRDRAYFPGKTHARAAQTAVSDKTAQTYQTYVDEASRGRSDAPGATGNASDEPGNRVLSGHRRRGEVVIETEGEGFVRSISIRRMMLSDERWRKPNGALPRKDPKRSRNSPAT